MGKISLIGHRAAAVLLLLAASTAVVKDADAADPPEKIRALILTGRDSHDWHSSTQLLRRVLLRCGRFDVRVIEEPTGTTSSTFDPYDVLVLNYKGPRWGSVTEEAVERFVRNGKGLVVVHWASASFPGPKVGDKDKDTDWVEYLKMIGGYWSVEPPRSGHGELHSFQVKIINRDHPITRGMKEIFVATDELYHRMRMQPGANVLATAFDDLKIGGTGKDEPILWTVSYGKGRVFHTTLGHNLAAMHEEGFKASFLRGTEWAATGEVTLPPDLSPHPAADSRLRVLVVTGGHDYPTSFYSIFDGVEDFEWEHATSNLEAFKSDIRGKFDVLVLYDMSRDIGATARKNLVDYLESGKGLVVLHHALVNYPSWEWWSQEVAGAKYFTQAEGDQAASTYSHDQELFIEPVTKHPILSGIGRMHFWDETYKGMWISPGVTVLLKTDNPLSDGPVAWVSPYEKSRVVGIQPGHDQTAHRHPAYQKLVRNAIRWAAGRLEDSKR
ncbi:MAG: ThuA domain-containing protein [Acidobacteria bacterium]|nr:ThuA domain-containing protein [Acidobacteriota bacterium]